MLSLQDTCREARNDADDLRHENSRLLSVVESLRQAGRDREKQWREFWQSKQQALGLDESHMNDLPPRAAGTPPTGELHPPGGAARGYVDEALRFQPNSHPTAGDPYPLPPGKDAEQRYPASLQPFTANPEGNWIPGPFSNTRTPCVGDAHPSQSSEASDSPPSISPVVQYSGRFPLGAEENRMSLLSMSNAGYGRCSIFLLPRLRVLTMVACVQSPGRSVCPSMRRTGTRTAGMGWRRASGIRGVRGGRTRGQTRAGATCMRRTGRRSRVCRRRDT